jgi:condensin-2 complex subunit G2
MIFQTYKILTRFLSKAQQIETIVQLLDDDTPDVRVTAIDGVCKVLSKFWIILSTQEINQLVGPMCRDLAFDASSPQVRQAVLRGFRLLVMLLTI